MIVVAVAVVVVVEAALVVDRQNYRQRRRKCVCCFVGILLEGESGEHGAVAILKDEGAGDFKVFPTHVEFDGVGF